MTIQEIKHPTQTLYDWADLNMFRLEKKALKDHVVNVSNETGFEPHLLSVVCQAILFNFSFEEMVNKPKGFPKD
jgi:hypothetical protein